MLNLGDAYWLPGPGNPADGLTKVQSDLGPLLRHLEPGRFRPGSLRSLKGAGWEEKVGVGANWNSSRARIQVAGDLGIRRNGGLTRA